MTGPSPPTPRRGRPARTKREIADMRAHIAACALDLFQAEGYEAVSMRRLAREAGCTPMTLYAYYAGKFDVLRALWSNVFDALFGRLDAVARAEDDPVRRIHALARVYVGYWLEHREHYFLVFMSGGVSQAEVKDYVANDTVVARFDLLREALAAATGLQGAALKLHGEMLICGLNGIAHSLVTIPGYPWSDPDDLAATAVEGLLAG